jgi:hypothetical protein
MWSGESRSLVLAGGCVPGCVTTACLTTLLFTLSSESGLGDPESDEEEEESVLVWTAEASLKPKPLDVDKTGTRAPKSEDVPCVPLVYPRAEVSGPDPRDKPQENSKRRKLSPSESSVYSDVAAKSTTSIPAMVIPHLVSHRPVASTGPGI